MTSWASLVDITNPTFETCLGSLVPKTRFQWSLHHPGCSQPPILYDSKCHIFTRLQHFYYASLVFRVSFRLAFCFQQV